MRVELFRVQKEAYMRPCLLFSKNGLYSTPILV